MRWKIELCIGSFPFTVVPGRSRFVAKAFFIIIKFEWRWKKINKKELKITSTKPSLIFRILTINQTV